MDVRKFRGAEQDVANVLSLYRSSDLIKTISRFKDVARSGCIRGDGKLVVAGDDSGLIQIFDINSRAILRTLDSHKQPVHVTKFSSLSPTHVLSCSDDTSVKFWDVPSQTPVITFTDHTDYVRSGQVSTSNPNLILTGSYDGTVRLFDARSGKGELTMAALGHSHSEKTPVEQVLMFPSGTVVLSSSGPILRVWDIVAGGRCVQAMSNHQKTITALAFNAKADRLLTGSLDQMVKVYDVSDYKVVHTMRYPAPLLCLAISPDETHILGGMSDGTLSVRRRDPKASEVPQQEHIRFDGPAILANLTLDSDFSQQKLQRKAMSDPWEQRVDAQTSKKLKEYDKLLKNFKYSAALDAVLKKNVPPTTTFSLIQELIHRDGLRIALAGRDDVLLEPILRLLLKYVADPRFGELAADITGIVIDMYMPVIGQAPLVDTLFLRLRKKLAAELKFQDEMIKVKGALTMILLSTVSNDIQI